jgi:hypothetical protein
MKSLFKQCIGFILVVALLGVEAAWAGSLSNGRMPGQSQRSIDSGYCPGSKIHVYHLSNCAHLYPEDRAQVRQPRRSGAEPTH